jgi:assimilatory nitrate reductase catalytic subunit
MKTTTPSTCPYCGVGCGVLIESERLLQPQQRSTRGANPQPVAWNQALDGLAQRLAATVQQHGPACRAEFCAVDWPISTISCCPPCCC